MALLACPYYICVDSKKCPIEVYWTTQVTQQKVSNISVRQTRLAQYGGKIKLDKDKHH